MDVHTEMAEGILIDLYDTSIYKISYKYYCDTANYNGYWFTKKTNIWPW